MSVVEFAMFWHDYELHGFEKVKSIGGNCLLLGYHSRCTLDLVYLLCFVQPSVIVSYLFYKVPIVRTLLPLVNIMPSKESNQSNDKAESGFIKALTESSRPLLLLPGGAYECLKPLSQRWKLQWKTEPGYARVIVKEKDKLGKRTKVVPFYTKNCESCLYHTDELYEFFGKWSNKLYSLFKKGNILVVPLMLTVMVLSLGCTLVPKPVKLDVYFGDPLSLKDDESSAQFSRRVETATQKLINDVEAMPQRTHKHRKMWSNSIISRVKFLIVGLYTVEQNFVQMSFVYFLIWLPVVVVLVVPYLISK